MIEILNLGSRLKSKLKKFKRLSQIAELPVELATCMTPTRVETDSDDNNSDDGDIVNDDPPAVNPLKSVPVSKWNVTKFSGDRPVYR